MAARNGHTEIVKVLLQSNAEVDAVDKNKKTPLHWAAEKGCKEIVSALIEKEANVNAKDQDGSTPLRWATRNDLY